MWTGAVNFACHRAFSHSCCSIQVGLRKRPIQLGSLGDSTLAAVCTASKSAASSVSGTYMATRDGRIAHVPSGSTCVQRVAACQVCSVCTRMRRTHACVGRVWAETSAFRGLSRRQRSCHSP